MNTATQNEDGTYCWSAAIDSAYNKKISGIIFGVIGGLCVLFIMMCLMTNSEMLMATLLSCLAVTAVVAGIAIPLMLLSKGRLQKYEMNEDYVHYVGDGRADARFYYPDIRYVRIYTSRSMIEVKGLIRAAPFFIAHEDFEFMKNYILQRLPASAHVEYE
jgi:hypothetical protein